MLSESTGIYSDLGMDIHYLIQKNYANLFCSGCMVYLLVRYEENTKCYLNEWQGLDIQHIKKFFHSLIGFS
jgi:hypothetical protein